MGLPIPSIRVGSPDAHIATGQRQAVQQFKGSFSIPRPVRIRGVSVRPVGSLGHPNLDRLAGRCGLGQSVLEKRIRGGPGGAVPSGRGVVIDVDHLGARTTGDSQHHRYNRQNRSPGPFQLATHRFTSRTAYIIL